VIVVQNRFFPIRSFFIFLVEGGIIFLSVMASFSVLRQFGESGGISFQDALIRGLVVAIFCQVCLYMLDLYDLKVSYTFGELFFSLIFAVGFVCIGIGLLSYVLPDFGIEGKMYYLTILFITVLLLVWRIAFDIYLKKIAPRENIAIMGTNQTADLVSQEVRKREKFGFRFVGFFDSAKPNDSGVPENGEILGSYVDMQDIVRERKIDKVVVALEERRGEYPVSALLALRVAGRNIVEWPDFFEKLSGRIPIENLAPSYFIFNDGFRKSSIVLMIRRIISTMVAAMACVVLFPIILVVALLIKLESPGPVFYTQKRVGQNGRVFQIYKFRSMRNDSEVEGKPQWATQDDPRITRVGRFIRPTRIDELPQFLNVLRGDLDIVGPRPERPEFVTELERVIPYYSLRHTVKPGVTGWAQVMFPYCGTIEESKEKLQYDLYYIKNMSIKLDLLILFRTLKIVVLGRGAR
jgi:sugar transferase (PEP-CTERM system associated)